MEHRIQIELMPTRVNSGKGNSERRYRVFHAGAELCVAREPLGASARKLLETGVAQRGDVILMCRGERVDMHGNVGWCADHTVIENRMGSPIWAKWTPFWGTEVQKTGNDDESDA